MNPFETFAAGIAPEHGLALVAGLLTAVWLGTATRRRPGLLVDRWAATLLGVSAAVHLTLPLDPHHGPLVTAGFLVSGTGFAVLAYRAVHGRRWRLPAALLVIATLVGYLAAVGGGAEADQVGIATALVELTAFGLAAVPAPQPGRPRRAARFAGSAMTMAAVILVGATVWIASFVAHQAATATAATATAATATAATATAATAPATGESASHDEHPGQPPHTDQGEHAHQHEHAGRSQAGVIIRPQRGDRHPTAEQESAATALAEATRQATARYADLDAALADGYAATLQMQGTDVHLEHKQRKSDGATLDPRRPEMLVYAVDGGRATLLGVVYVMETAGAPGPQPGGPITAWHAHNLCVSALPPGIGVVSPFGGCPAFSVSVTSPEMMHVWVVDNPGGPFAEGLDEAWVRTYHSQHGRPFHRP